MKKEDGGENNMAANTFFEKSVVSEIKNSNMNSIKAKRINRAIVNLDSSSLESLCRAGRVRKMNIKDKNNLYLYRINNRERIVFSVIDGKKVIHDIIDVDSIKSQNKD